MDMSDATVFEVLIPQVLTPLTSLLVQSFGSVWDESLIPGCGAACFSGEAGALFPFAFNDIESSETTRVSKLRARPTAAPRPASPRAALVEFPLVGRSQVSIL